MAQAARERRRYPGMNATRFSVAGVAQADDGDCGRHGWQAHKHGAQLGARSAGKEVLTQGLHELGSRAKQPSVAISCEAIPENLLESVLFGHERCGLTGTASQTLDKIKQAN